MLKVLLHAASPESGSAPWLPVLLLIPAVAGTAFLQVWSTTVGVQLFSLLLFVPVQVALQILLTTVYGLVFFDEVPTNEKTFALYSALIMVGVLATQAAQTESGEDGRDQDYIKIDDGPSGADYSSACMGA